MAGLGALTSQASLGAGIGLSGTPKNYVPEAMRAEQFQQKLQADKDARALAAAAKKKEEEAVDEEKINKQLANFKITGGLPYTTKRRQELALEWKNALVEAREKNPGKSPYSDIDFLMKQKAIEDEFKDIANEAENYQAALNRRLALKEENKYDIVDNVELEEAVNDPSGELMKAHTKKTFNRESPRMQVGDRLFDVRTTDIYSEMRATAGKIKPNVDELTKRYNAGDNQYVEDTIKEYDESRLKSLESLKTLKSWQNESNRIAKDIVAQSLGAKPYEQAKLEADDILSKQFEVMVPANIHYVKQTAGPTPSAARSWKVGDSPNTNTSFNFVTGAKSTEDLAGFAFDQWRNNQIDWLEGKDVYVPVLETVEENGKEIKRVKRDASGEIITEPKGAVPTKLLSDYKALKLKGSIKESDIIELYKKHGLAYQTRESLGAPFKGKYDNIMEISHTDFSPNKKYDLIVDAGSDQTEKATPYGITKNKKGEYQLIAVDEQGIVKRYPLKDNKPFISGEFGVDEAFDWEAWYEKKSKEKTGTTKSGKYVKEEGGYTNKQVTKKFHDKANKKTKLVFDDGSEEIINGLF